MWEETSNRHLLRWLKTVVVSEVEKASVTASDGDQEESKPGSLFNPGMSLAGAHRLARRCPAWRRREPGLRLSHGTWEGSTRHSGLRFGRREGALQAADP